MSSPTSDADFGFWFLTIPKNSEKKLEMENDSSVYHVSNATLGNKVSGGRTTVSFKSNGKKAPICNLVNGTLENASLDLIVSRSMNASFVTKGPNAVTVSGYVQPLVDESDNDSSGATGLPVTNGADGAVNSVEVKENLKVAEPKATKAPVKPKPEAMEVEEPKAQEKAELKEEEEAKSKPEAKEKKPAAKEEDEPKPKDEEKLEAKQDKMEEEKSEEKTSTADKQKESLKRKLDEAQATDSTKPEKKKNKKKKKKKKKNQNTEVGTPEKKVNGAGKPMEVEKAPEVKPAEEEKKSEKVQDKAKSNEMDVEETAKEVSKKPEKEAEAVIEKPTEEKPAEDSSETPTKAKDAKESKPKSKKSKKMVKAGKGVTYRVLKKGKAGVKPAKKGDSITLLYVGCLKDGTQFDKNLKDGLTFKIGGEEVIPGIELGVMGMCPKEKRRIIIPPEQGYGEDGASEGKIPPNAELHFTVQRK